MGGPLGGAIHRLSVDVQHDGVELAVAFYVEFERVGGGGGQTDELGFVGEIVAGDLVDAVAEAQPGAGGGRAGYDVGQDDGARCRVVEAPGDPQAQRLAGELDGEVDGLGLAGSADDQRGRVLGGLVCDPPGSGADVVRAGRGDHRGPGACFVEIRLGSTTGAARPGCGLWSRPARDVPAVAGEIAGGRAE